MAQARLRITQGPREGGGPWQRVCPHPAAILEAGVPVLYTGLPRIASRYAAHTHAGVLFHLRGSLLWDSWLGHRGIAGVAPGTESEALADPATLGPVLPKG